MKIPKWYCGGVTLKSEVLVDEKAIASGKKLGFSVTLNDAKICLSFRSKNLKNLKIKMKKLLRKVNWESYSIDLTIVDSELEDIFKIKNKKNKVVRQENESHSKCVCGDSKYADDLACGGNNCLNSGG